MGIETRIESYVEEKPEPPPHVSYSALTDWLKCGWYFYLKRALDLPERRAWWNAGGHAVHKATEQYDRQVWDAIGV